MRRYEPSGCFRSNVSGRQGRQQKIFPSGYPIEVLDLRVELFDEVHAEGGVSSIGINGNFVDAGAMGNYDSLLLSFELDFCIGFFRDGFLMSNQQNPLV